jgi:hypothetical protein
MAHRDDICYVVSRSVLVSLLAVHQAALICFSSRRALELSYHSPVVVSRLFLVSLLVVHRQAALIRFSSRRALELPYHTVLVSRLSLMSPLLVRQAVLICFLATDGTPPPCLWSIPHWSRRMVTHWGSGLVMHERGWIWRSMLFLRRISKICKFCVGSSAAALVVQAVTLIKTLHRMF